MDELKRVSVEQFHNQEKMKVVCVLDNVRSQHNIGSVFRTADEFNIEKICLCGITATPPHREIQKTALGATESVKWEYHADVLEALHELRAEGYVLVAIEQAVGSVELQEYYPLPGQKTVLIFGNEVEGVSDQVMEIVDACIEIPQFGTKHSLNVSVTAGIVFWSFYLPYASGKI